VFVFANYVLQPSQWHPILQRLENEVGDMQYFWASRMAAVGAAP
jgi:hypothetical protein